MNQPDNRAAPPTKEATPLLTDDQRIDEAGAESFPASDPPSWTSGLDRRQPD